MDISSVDADLFTERNQKMQNTIANTRSHAPRARLTIFFDALKTQPYVQLGKTPLSCRLLKAKFVSCMSSQTTEVIWTYSSRTIR